MSHMARHGHRPPDWLSGARSALSLLHFFLVFSRSAPDLQYECLDCRPNKTSANLRSRIPEHNFPIFLVLLNNQCKYHCPLLHCSWRYYRGWQNTSDKLEGFGSFWSPSCPKVTRQVKNFNKRNACNWTLFCATSKKFVTKQPKVKKKCHFVLKRASYFKIWRRNRLWVYEKNPTLKFEIGQHEVS